MNAITNNMSPWEAQTLVLFFLPLFTQVPRRSEIEVKFSEVSRLAPPGRVIQAPSTIVSPTVCLREDVPELSRGGR